MVTPTNKRLVRGRSRDSLKNLTSKLPPNLSQQLRESVNSFVNSLPGDKPECEALRKSVFKKFSGGLRDPKLAVVAKRAFLETEKQCADTNRRVSAWIRRNESYADARVLALATRKISSILGNFSVPEMCNRARFGPGSTFEGRGADVSWARKFSLTDVTPEFKKDASYLLHCHFPPWVEAICDSAAATPLLTMVPGGRYSTVAKNETTDRSIIVEPTINSFFQQGIGQMIRARLKRWCGIDLEDQSLNQRLAKLGSLTDDLATVDMSNASDLISKKLVYDLLPEEWYHWMDLTRSRRVLIDGQWVELEKFSSMGNGFTFDLETLIFYALAWAVSVDAGANPFWVTAYGDDLIVPTMVQEQFLKLFSDCGFAVNTAKSYFSGPFRESCGHDYYEGRNIRGVYIKSLGTAIDVMKVHNRFFEWSRRTGIDSAKLRDELAQSCPLLLRYRVPMILGDVGLFSSFDEACPPVARDHPRYSGWEGFRIRTIKPVMRERDRYDRFLMLQRLVQHNTEGREQGNNLSLRLVPVGYVEKEIVSLWED